MDQTAAAINTVNQSRLNNRSESGKTQAEGQAKRQQKERIKLNEETLTNKEKGLKRLYEESLKLNVKGNPEDDLKRLMNLYKEWHFQLAPKFEFSYFIQKCQILGQKAPIRAFMSRIRNVHRGELT